MKFSLYSSLVFTCMENKWNIDMIEVLYKYDKNHTKSNIY